MLSPSKLGSDLSTRKVSPSSYSPSYCSLDRSQANILDKAAQLLWLKRYKESLDLLECLHKQNQVHPAYALTASDALFFLGQNEQGKAALELAHQHQSHECRRRCPEVYLIIKLRLGFCHMFLHGDSAPAGNAIMAAREELKEMSISCYRSLHLHVYQVYYLCLTWLQVFCRDFDRHIFLCIPRCPGNEDLPCILVLQQHALKCRQWRLAWALLEQGLVCEDIALNRKIGLIQTFIDAIPKGMRKFDNWILPIYGRTLLSSHLKLATQDERAKTELCRARKDFHRNAGPRVRNNLKNLFYETLVLQKFANFPEPGLQKHFEEIELALNDPTVATDDRLVVELHCARLIAAIKLVYVGSFSFHDCLKIWKETEDILLSQGHVLETANLRTSVDILTLNHGDPSSVVKWHLDFRRRYPNFKAWDICIGFLKSDLFSHNALNDVEAAYETVKQINEQIEQRENFRDHLGKWAQALVDNGQTINRTLHTTGQIDIESRERANISMIGPAPYFPMIVPAPYLQGDSLQCFFINEGSTNVHQSWSGLEGLHIWLQSALRERIIDVSQFVSLLTLHNIESHIDSRSQEDMIVKFLEWLRSDESSSSNITWIDKIWVVKSLLVSSNIEMTDDGMRVLYPVASSLATYRLLTLNESTTQRHDWEDFRGSIKILQREFEGSPVEQTYPAFLQMCAIRAEHRLAILLSPSPVLDPGSPIFQKIVQGYEDLVSPKWGFDAKRSECGRAILMWLSMMYEKLAEDQGAIANFERALRYISEASLAYIYSRWLCFEFHGWHRVEFILRSIENRTWPHLQALCIIYIMRRVDDDQNFPIGKIRMALLAQIDHLKAFSLGWLMDIEETCADIDRGLTILPSHLKEFRQREFIFGAMRGRILDRAHPSTRYFSDSTNDLGDEAKIAQTKGGESSLIDVSMEGHGHSLLSALRSMAQFSHDTVVFVDWFFQSRGPNERFVVLTFTDPDQLELPVNVCEITTPFDQIQLAVNEFLSYDESDLVTQRAHETLQKLSCVIQYFDICTFPGDVLVLSPCGFLGRIPIHALELDGNPLIARNPIVYSNSITELNACYRRRITRERPAGDRLPNGKAAFFGNPPSEAGKHSFREAATKLGATLYDPACSTTGQFLSSANNPSLDILHFQGHTSPENQDPLQRGLNLGDRTLTVMDLFEAKKCRNAHHAMLLGCGTGIQMSMNCYQRIGIVPAFHYWGSASVVSTLWDIDDKDAALFCDWFYTKMIAEAPLGSPQCKVNLARLVQGSILEIRENRPEIYHWAPFVLSGYWAL